MSLVNSSTVSAFPLQAPLQSSTPSTSNESNSLATDRIASIAANAFAPSTSSTVLPQRTTSSICTQTSNQISRNPSEVRSYYASLYQSDPQKVYSDCQRCLQRDPQYAYELSKLLLTIDPRNQYFLIVRAQSALAKGAFQEARDFAVACLNLNPNNVNPEAKNIFARALLYMNHFSEAKKQALELLEINSRDDYARATLSGVFLGLKVYQIALKCGSSVLSRIPNDPIALYTVVKAAYALKQYELAIKTATTLLTANPVQNEIRMVRAESYAEMGDYKKALEDLGHLSGGLCKRNLQARIHVLSGNLEEAKKDVSYVLETGENDYASITSARIALLEGDYQKAVDETRYLLQRYPKDLFLSNTLAAVYGIMSFRDESILVITEMVKEHPANADAKAIMQFLHFTFKITPDTELLRQVNNILRVSPQNYFALYTQALIHFDCSKKASTNPLEKYALALGDASAVLEKNPNDLRMRHIRAECFLQGNPKNPLLALEDLLFIQRKYPYSSDVKLMSLQALAHFQLGNRQEAEKGIEDVLKIDPENKSVLDLRNKLEAAIILNSL